MVDAESVRRKLREIERRLVALRGISGRDRGEFLADDALQAQAERHLQIAIQAAIDVANHIVAEDSAETPEDYGSTFVLLARMGVVDEELAGRLRSAAGLRNILVHAYTDVDATMLWERLAELDDLERFVDASERYVSNPRE